MNLSKRILSFVTASLVSIISNNTYAQSRRPAGVGSLGEMKCQNINGSGYTGLVALLAGAPNNYKASNSVIIIDPEGHTLTAIAYIKALARDEELEIWCKIDRSSSSGSYKKLTLSFAFDARDAKKTAFNASVLHFSVYRKLTSGLSEPSFYDQFFLRPALYDKGNFEIDLTNVDVIKFKLKCAGYNSCPTLYFFRDLLK
ncbi:hypothetical protein QT971_19130 [Microcoleus sp. herbarium19]|uniref:hypothetical protein n=1 Tax=unclassified Microcoleus TaxID=2642155 RepID=UPI002FD07518